MKTKALTLICLLTLLCLGNPCSLKAANQNKINSAADITVYSSPDMFDLASKWAGEYGIAYPGRNIKVVKLGEEEIAVQVTAANEIFFLSQESASKVNPSSLFRIVVGREIIVPVISAKNPFLREIREKGISAEALALSLATPGKMNWGSLLNNGQNSAVKYYMLNDGYTKTAVEGFLNSPGLSLDRFNIETSSALLSKVENDPYALGFCRLNDILAPGGKSFAGNISILPIDKNNNGRMDYMEDIYANFQDFSRGVWIGKYPKALTSNLYCVSKTQPSGAEELAFLRWVLGSGQQILPGEGYSDLVSSERQSQMDKLYATISISREIPKESSSFWKIAITVLAIIVLLGFVLDIVIGRFRKGSSKDTGILQQAVEGFDESKAIAPKGIYFDKTHTWAFMEQDGLVKVGIDDFLQHVTGTITSIGMKKPGDRIKKGDQLCIVIQKGKHLNIYAPVSGTVKAYNEDLSKNPSLLNKSPYSAGWVYLVEPSNWMREIEFLSMADKYRVWLKAEFTRLKDFLAASLQANSPGQAQLVLQDGGMLRDHVLAELGPEVWEDFQTMFINSSR